MAGKNRKPNNRVKCWLCDKWVLERHTQKVPFNDTEESICISCYNSLTVLDEGKELELRVQEEMMRDATPKDSEQNPPGEYLNLPGPLDKTQEDTKV
jgi:hypothetical protein